MSIEEITVESDLKADLNGCAPRSVRNWWITIDVDGKETQVNLGPRSAAGGFSMRIYQRHNRSVCPALHIGAYAIDEALTMTITNKDARVIHTTKSVR